MKKVIHRIKHRLMRPRVTEHEVIDLKTGKKLRLVRVKRPDGTYSLEKLEGSERDPTIFEEAKEEREVAKESKKSGRRDLLDILEEDIDTAVKIKEERDTLFSKIEDMHSRLEDVEEHKEARKRAEDKLSDLEEQIVRMKDEKSELEDSIGRLKDERKAVEDKIKKYEKALLRVKEKVIDFDRRIK